MTGRDLSGARLPPASAATTARVRILLALGGLAVVGGLVLAPDRLWLAWFMLGQYVIQLGLAGTFVIAVLYATGASWGVAIRRVPEALTALLPIGAVALAIVWVAYPELYPWVHEPHGGDFKRAWLSWPFFLGRALVYVALWIGLSMAIVRVSRRQDVTGRAEDTATNGRLSAIFLAVFAVTFSLASFDWIMSREPEWFSTIFGVYVFAGLFLTGLAAITVTVIWLHETGPFRNILTEDHLHDLGKLLFGMSTFWMYIWFSQYMLIWYANIPEESVYFVTRLEGVWGPLLLLNIVLNWALPFVVLLRRSMKLRRDVMLKVALVLLVGHWLDLYVMIGPSAGGVSWDLLVDLGLSLGALGVVIVVVRRALSGWALVPVNDPRLHESLHYYS